MITEIPKVKNKQGRNTRNSLICSLVFVVLVVLPFYEGNPLSDLWGVSFIALSASLTSLIMAVFYNKRSNKMKSLLNQTTLLAGWEMEPEMKNQYVTELSREIYSRSKMLLWVISGFFLLFTVIFLFMVGDNWPVFIGIMGSAYLVIFIAGITAPPYYTSRNRKGDGYVLVGSKYIYINGYFHNWDFPLSGLSSIRPICDPFIGIELTYYYTIRRSVQTHEIRIPTPDSVDIEKIIIQIKLENT